MQVEILQKFTKDTDTISSKIVLKNIVKAISNVEKANKISDIPNIKKLKGHDKAYRIRIGTYRIGLYIEGSVVFFVRILTRANIYKYFPK